MDKNYKYNITNTNVAKPIKIKLNIYGDDAIGKNIDYDIKMSLYDSKITNITDKLYLITEEKIKRKYILKVGNFLNDLIVLNKELIPIFTRPGDIQKLNLIAERKRSEKKKDTKQNIIKHNLDLLLDILFGKNSRLFINNQYFNVYSYEFADTENIYKEYPSHFSLQLNIVLIKGTNVGIIQKQRYTCKLVRDNLRKSIFKVFNFDIGEKKKPKLKDYKLPEQIINQTKTRKRYLLPPKTQYPYQPYPYPPYQPQLPKNYKVDTKGRPYVEIKNGGNKTKKTFRKIKLKNSNNKNNYSRKN